MIVALSDFETIDVYTPWGKERGIFYLGQTFMPIKVYKGIHEAIAACRRDLDAGLLSIVVTESNRFSVWWQLPDL
ncbi:C-type lectin domain-containing protein [Tumidithrix helvetica PCC 7403]